MGRFRKQQGGDPWGAQISEFDSSGEQTSSGVIHDHESLLGGILITTDGVNDATVTLYDNASAGSGTKLLPTIVVPAADRLGGVMGVRVHAANGIYLTISGTNAKAVVYTA